MNQIDSAVKTFDNTVKGWLSFIDNNEYVTAALTIFLIVYASYAAPKLPPYILKMFDNPLFKLLIFFLIVYTANKNPTVAIIAAVAFMVTIHALNKLKLDQMMMALMCKEKEHMANQEQEMGRRMEHTMEHEIMDDHASEYAMEEIARPEFIIPEGAPGGIQTEVKGQPLAEQEHAKCGKRAQYRNSFYPQYVNMKPDAYMARYTGNEVNGFDANAAYASI